MTKATYIIVWEEQDTKNRYLTPANINDHINGKTIYFNMFAPFKWSEHQNHAFPIEIATKEMLYAVRMFAAQKNSKLKKLVPSTKEKSSR